MPKTVDFGHNILKNNTKNIEDRRRYLTGKCVVCFEMFLSR